jgi:hypothetical protein
MLPVTPAKISRAPGAWAIVSLVAALIGPSIGVAAESSTLENLRVLYDQRDFFALRDTLPEVATSPQELAEIQFLRAATEQAFNRPAASNATLTALLARPDLERELTLRARHLQLTNHLRLHRYAAALESAGAIISQLDEGSESPIGLDVRSKVPLLQALADVPPQATDVRGPSRLALGKTRRIPLTIQGTKYSFALDTGANFSVIRRSEAQKLGLEIRPANLVISTSTARQVVGDVTVAREVEIGKIRYSNVVFLVLPDELLSFPDGQQIQGLVGFPVIEAMGEVIFRRDNVMEIPNKPQRRAHQNLALNDLDPIVQVRYGKDSLLCRLDTGADLTVFYEPFFQRYRDRVESSGHPITAKAGGVGGSQEIPAYRLPKVALTLASAGVTLRRAEVYTVPIRGPDKNYLYCNVGLDALERFRSYVINFRDMALVLR